ncbi:MAG: hypothetical protein HY401_00455 [Elusimicrobia bacterium]|nr:hypothetical protein [Elusimicrobiota bacterium]
MLLVIDTNEYLFAFGREKYQPAIELLTLLENSCERHQIRICQTIVEEVRRNIPAELMRPFIAYAQSLTTVDDDYLIPANLFAKYESIGLKPGDAFIGAYAEFVGAQAIVSENRRHFHKYRDKFPFAVWDAAACLKELKKG